jgi:hypothetical protein
MVPKIIGIQGKEALYHPECSKCSRFQFEFTYVLTGWEGSAHDASTLAEILSRLDGLKIHVGKLYLRDGRYACYPKILPPFGKTRYHPNEFTSRNISQNAKKSLNVTHSSLRVSIERAFAALENRFHYEAQVIARSCLLHSSQLTLSMGRR